MNPGATPETPLAPGRGVGSQSPTPRSIQAGYWLLGLFVVGGALCYLGLAL